VVPVSPFVDTTADLTELIASGQRISPLRVIQTERKEKTRGISLGVTGVSASLTRPSPFDRLLACFSDRDTHDLDHLVASFEDHALCCCESGADEAGDRIAIEVLDEHERLLAGVQPAAVAAVFIGAPPDVQEGADAVAAAFGLTPAETKVIASLFAGRTLDETAATLGITRPTAKTHLEHIFLKTGVTRQAELMRIWTGLISPTGSSI
jgi:DNA-binding CsgD family transcriptional regulator